MKPPPPPDWTPLDGACKPLLDELLLDPLDESPLDPVDPVELLFELPLDPEFEVEPVDELEPDEDVPPVLVTAA